MGYAKKVHSVLKSIKSVHYRYENSKNVYAFDLWVSASDNYGRIKQNNLEERIIPIHGDDSELFKTVEWWKNLLEAECGDTFEVDAFEAECYDIAWKEWFDTGHEFAMRDKEYLDKGLYDLLNFVLIYVKKK